MKQNLKLKLMTLGEQNILIKKFIKGIEGGRTLDLTDFVGDFVKAGHVIVKTAAGVYKPLALAEGGEAYAAKGETDTYAGLLQHNVLVTEVKNNAAAIMTWGIVNEAVLPYAVPADFKTAMPHIDYQKDEEA